ncbi:MAG: YraN family protein [Ignavibacteria bacterium]|nr:YraN family protein [Ignavibacteria bacterium]
MNRNSNLSTHEIGAYAEQLAVDYLLELGYVIIERNFFYKKVGEIDIVTRIASTLVFVEVRYRSNPFYGPPESTLSRIKLHRIRRTAEAWLICTRTKNIEIRFDVIAIDLHEGAPEIRHLINAF